VELPPDYWAELLKRVCSFHPPRAGYDLSKAGRESVRGVDTIFALSGVSDSLPFQIFHGHLQDASELLR
jgi:hypothetical protein